jgi:drug/metabolite transporter (DMT)-like permease
MSLTVFIVVIFAAFLHATWNAMVKNEKDKYLAVSGIVFGHVPASIVVIFFIPSPSVESIPYIILSAILHNGYQWFLLSAYKFGDYTKVYPIARGSAPIFVSIVSLIFFAVVLSRYELLGIAVICLGILSLSFQDSTSITNRKAIIYALITGSFIMGYSITDGYGARISASILSYMGWSFILNAFLFAILLNFKKQPGIITRVAKDGKFIFFVGGTISYLVYAIIVWGFTQAPIPVVTALREISIVFALLIGTFFLKEKFTYLKTTAVLTIFFGVILLKFF